VSNPSFDLLIRGGRVVTGHLDEPLDLGVRDGRIAALLRPGVPASAHRVADASGLVVLPGGIDTHTHVAWPYGGMTTRDGFAAATRAAARGGTTTLIDFVPPNARGQRLADACDARIRAITGAAAIDVGLHPILNRSDEETLGDIGAVVARGLTSFKMYTTYEENRVGDGDVWRLTREIARHGGLPGFHAENHELLVAAEADLAADGRTSVPDFPGSRPALAEAAAIETVTLIGRTVQTPVYIFHVSGGEALAAVERARAAGTTVHAETCTHYLAFDETVFARPDGWKFVITPPIRGAADRERLWDAVGSGGVVSVGSDHCAYPLSEKSAHPEDHRRTPPGAAGIQSRTPVLWNEAVNVRGLAASVFAAVSAERAARALGMYPRKGTIAVGADADLVLLDPTASWTGPDLPAASDDTFDLYDRYEGRGLPRAVYVRGEPVVEDGRLTDGPPRGGFLARDRVR